MTTLTDVLREDAAPAAAPFCHFRQDGREILITYGDLRREARRHADHFAANGVRRGEVVLIVLRHSPELFYAFLGAMLIGAVPSFMPAQTNKQNPRIYWSSHRKLFARIGSGALVTSAANIPALREHLPDLTLRQFEIESFAASSAPPSVPIPGLPTDLAFLQHSSGTTGLKKGVALTHAAVLSQIERYARTLGLGPGDRIVSWLPLYHDMGLIACFLLPLVTRTPVVMLDPFEWAARPGLLFEAAHQHHATLCWMPNFAFQHLCRTVRPAAAPDLSSVRAWIDCSEPCHPETFAAFARTFAGSGVRPEHLQVCYAMAETVFAVTQTPPGRPPRTLTVEESALRDEGHIVSLASSTGPAFLSAGLPLPDLAVRILDEQGAPLPADRVGEIAVAGVCLFTGYFKLDEETRRKLRDGWYRTGDLGFLHDGELYVTGRKSDLIIVHGRNYHAHELEYVVNRVPGVHPGRNVAVGWYRAEVGSEDVVILAESDAEDAAKAALVAAIKQCLLDEAGLLPYDVQIVPPGWLVKTTSGKFSRIENLNQYLAARTAPLAQTA